MAGSMADPRKTPMSLDSAWASLEAGLHIVFESPSKGREGRLDAAKYMQLYSTVHDYCTQTARPSGMHANRGMNAQNGATLVGRDIYDKVTNFLTLHCSEWLAEGQYKTGDDILTFFADMWSKYTFSARVCNNLFAYLNRHWVPRAKEEEKKDVYQVYQLTLVMWRENFFMPLRAQVFEAMVGMITRERNGEGVNTQLLRSITDCFVALGLDEEDEAEETNVMDGQLTVYKQFFEDDFLKSTEEYYTEESVAFLEENQVTEYMKKALTRLEQESRRVQAYLHESTRDSLAKKCEDVLIEAHKERLHGEFQPLLDAEKTEDLRRMYELSLRIANGEGLKPLRELLEKHVIQQGIAAVQHVENPASPDVKVFVDCLLSVHKKYTEMVRQAFDNDATFVAAMDRACKSFVNKNAVTVAAGNSTKSPELLAKYCHGLLKKGSKIAEGQDVEVLLEGVMVIFQYLEDNDVFQKYYSKLLAQRLVNSASESDDFESSMISKLKQKCGFEWTQKFQRMFTDISTSRGMMRKFGEGQGAKQCLKGFSMMVLTSGSWPFSVQENVAGLRLPPVLQTCKDKLELFYGSQHQGRKLMWLYNLGSCEVNLTYTKNPKSGKPQIYAITTNTMQLSVLLQYAEKDEWTVDELMANTDLNREAMDPIVEILLKSKLVQKKGSKLTLNMGFKNKKTRVSIKVVTKREAKAENEDVHKTIQEDRKLLMQAVIVRIMKMRKDMTMNTLIPEAIKQLEGRFTPKIPMLKKEIEVLIDKEYLERDDKDRSHLRYLA
mmetsp:Transcript_21702/g.56653  ORF Transcript_21702/g.56653 Transcript_21702/m.56653 type:complete len:776 (+) Transcript_21702:89-2416(+)